MEGGNPGADWTDQQNDLIVSDCFAMLSLELAGESYVKSHHNAALQAQTGRSKGSIERKHMNISAVMMRLGLPRIRGYAPYPNFQIGLIGAVERHLNNSGLPAFRPKTSPGSQLNEAPYLWIGPPPTTNPNYMMPNPALERLIRKFDPAERDARNRLLGKDGEQLVFDNEVLRLATNGRNDLARKVEWTSQVRGDGAGYDISSFELDGRPRLIEVKTTNGSVFTPFHLTENERMVSEERSDAFRLLRIYDFVDEPKAFELAPPLHSFLALNPTNYRATLL